MPAHDAAITANRKISGEYYLLELRARGLGKGARPGRFYMLKVGAGTDPLLRRPFCLHRAVSDDEIKILYRAQGYGTRLMTKMAPGDFVNVLGPLGNGFRVGRDVKTVLIVGGGVGVASLMALAEHIAKTRSGTKAVCFIGGRGRGDVLGIKEFRGLGLRVYVTTEDGSLPRKGYVTDSLEQYILRHGGPGAGGMAIYSCGPTPMLRGVAAIAKMNGIKNYASLESNMACGIGACTGCVVGVLDREHGSVVYKKVCDDGPVFDADDVAW